VTQHRNWRTFEDFSGELLSETPNRSVSALPKTSTSDTNTNEWRVTRAGTVNVEGGTGGRMCGANACC